MRRTAGTIERACELVGAAITWGLDVSVTVERPKGSGRPTYSVLVDSPAESDTQAAIVGDEST